MSKLPQVPNVVNSLDGLAIIGEDITTDTLHIAKVTGRRHDNVISKFEKFIDDCSDLGLLIFKETSEYVDSDGRAQPMYTMNGDTAIQFLGSFTKKTGMVVMNYLFQQINHLKDMLRQKDKEAVKMVERYRLTDTNDCSNLTSVCGRFDLTPQKANNALVEANVLKRVRNKGQIIYRLKAGYLGKDYCNIDQDCDDFYTHLKWTDKNGVAFLTEFFEIQKEKDLIRKREEDLRKHPVLPGFGFTGGPFQ